MQPDLRLQSGPHVFVDDLELAQLLDDDRHHLARSLRLRDGDPITMSDANHRWRTARFGDVVEPTGPVHEVEPPRYEVGLGVALTKAAKPEFAVQKATEIGIDRVVVFRAEHSVARWDEAKRARNVLRLTKVAREAAMQSRRVSIPVIEVLDEFDSLLQFPGVVRADFGGIATNAGHRLVLVGPEGGWSSSERDRIPDTVDLGKTVLRAETAAVVASSFLVAARDRTA